MSEANPRLAGATATDEFSARQQEVDEALASE